MASQGDMNYPTLDAIAPLSPVRRIERKSKKKESIIGGWREIFLEKLAAAGLSSSITIEDASTVADLPEDVRDDLPVIISSQSGTKILIESEEDLQLVLRVIKRMSDDPEQLFESHLNLFIEPAPPGKVLNSQG